MYKIEGIYKTHVVAIIFRNFLDGPEWLEEFRPFWSNNLLAYSLFYDSLRHFKTYYHMEKLHLGVINEFVDKNVIFSLQKH